MANIVKWFGFERRKARYFGYSIAIFFKKTYAHFDILAYFYKKEMGNYEKLHFCMLKNEKKWNFFFHFFRLSFPKINLKMCFMRKKFQKKFQEKISNFVNFLAIIVIFHNFPFLFYKKKLRYQNGHMFSWKKLPYNIRNILPSFSQSQITLQCLP